MYATSIHFLSEHSLGGPGVDAHVRHEAGEAVLHAQFLINEGALVTATADDQLHLWTFRQKSPQRVQSLKFQRERITCLHLPLQSKWVHVGTERGNVHVVNIETFALSGYVINWNKAIEVYLLMLSFPKKMYEMFSDQMRKFTVPISNFAVELEHSLADSFEMSNVPIVAACRTVTSGDRGGTRPNHPGSVVAISENPLDASKLLIAFESGLIVVWDLRARAVEWRGGLAGAGVGAPDVRAAAWQHDGKLMTAHADGALATWTTRAPRPSTVTYPHAKANKDGKLEPCKPIHRLEWKTSRSGESLVIFSGGLPTDKAGRTHSVTVLNGKSTTVLEMEHSVVDFVTLCESPHAADYQEPYAIVVLLQNDLVLVVLLSPGYPCFENPYPMDIHESPVTCCSYSYDCPSDLIPAFYSVGRQGNKKVAGFSEKLWPINGGEWAPASCSYSEIILTGRGGDSAEGEGRKSCGGVWAGGALRVRGGAGTGGSRRAPGFQPALAALQLGPPHPVTTLTINSSYGLMAWGGERGVVVVDMFRRCVVAALPPHALYLPEPGARPHDRQRSPSLDQLEETHASPAASPDPALAPAPAGPAPDEHDDRKLDTRRRSTSWKTFNLKRQLSKVDLKFKSAFTVPPENNVDEEKGNSQFYCDPVEKSDPTPESNVENPEVIEKATEATEEDKDLSSPLRVCSDVFERMHKELQEKRSSDVYDRMHKELQERWQDKDNNEITPDLSPSKLEEEKVSRPDNLPLFDEDGKPTRPPRQKSKKKEEGREQREQRLLSVPNIKYRQEAAREARKRQSAGPAPPPSFAGNLMRRFRDFVASLCTRKEPNDEKRTNEEVIEVPNPIGMISDAYNTVHETLTELNENTRRMSSYEHA
ncbi:Syntaxin-binding protein 5 [Papilio machaon]|uniref:Syntaxin-binding protein 5 n=1 Tax=Papilio machaon TaxID=76193 RepID=A0A0N1IE52_PAPMA|nr:Syntaxin-binding protein 5 [Papilio machaon]